MPLLVTGVLPFLAHDHASAAAFLTCRHDNFHSSIIPEFLSDEERVELFCEARQQNQLRAVKTEQSSKLYTLFIQTPLMQFSSSLVLRQKDCNETILKPLLSTKYFTRTLQCCSFCPKVEVTNDLLQGLSKVQSLSKLDLGESEVQNEHLEIIINSFPNLETLTLQKAGLLKIVDPSEPAISISSPPPAATKTLRSLTMRKVEPLFAMQFISHFTNLRKLALRGQGSSQELDLQPLSSSLPRLTDLSVAHFELENTESLKNLVHLSTLEFHDLSMPDSLSFLAQEENGTLPELTSLCIDSSLGFPTSSFSFAPLSHASNVQALKIFAGEFNNDCLQYLENMAHLRKLDLTSVNIVGDSRLLNTLTQKLKQLEELTLRQCRIGDQGVISAALYSTHSRLRVLKLSYCDLVDEDLNGIGALKNTLEVLDLSSNDDLTSKGLMHLRDLVKLKNLNLHQCSGITDLSPLKGCLNLEELNLLNVLTSQRLNDNSFKVFSKEPNSFPNLRVLSLGSYQCTEKVFEHLSKNRHLVYQLKELNLEGLTYIVSSSDTARRYIYQLKGLRRLSVTEAAGGWELDVERDELMREMRNLDEIP